MVPEQALQELSRQVYHHRTPEARAVLAEALAGLKQVFCTKSDVIILTSSGTGAMEAAVVNLLAPGDKAIVLDAGRFAQRWVELCEAYGITVVRHTAAWGTAVNPQDVARLLDEHPDAAVVFGTLQETSTGVAHDIEAIGQVVGPSKALFVVDGISGVGVQECRTDDWNVDCLIVGSQKALMLPPGLAFISVSDAAWKRIDSFKSRSFYFNLKAYKKKLADPDTPFTPAHTLVGALNQCIKLILGEGLETVWAKARKLARATRVGVEALGLEVYAERPSDGVTSVRFPEGVDGSKLLKRIENRYGIKLAGGQAHLTGKIFRIAHLGQVDEIDIIGTLYALEMTLNELGHPVEPGGAVRAASAVMSEVETPATV